MQLGRVQPDPHRILGAELGRGPDAPHALQRIEQARSDDIVERVGVFGAVVRPDGNDYQKSGVRLGDRHALRGDLDRQARQRK